MKKLILLLSLIPIIGHGQVLTGNLVITTIPTGNATANSTRTVLPDLRLGTQRFIAGNRTAGIGGVGSTVRFLALEEITEHARYAFLDNSGITYPSSGSQGHASFAAYPHYLGSASSDHMYAFQDRSIFDGSGTLDKMASVFSYPILSGNGTITTLKNYDARSPDAGATIGTQYYYWAQGATGRAGTTYAFYSDGAAPSRLGGPLTVVGESTSYIGTISRPSSDGSPYTQWYYTDDTERWAAGMDPAGPKADAWLLRAFNGTSWQTPVLRVDMANPTRLKVGANEVAETTLDVEGTIRAEGSGGTEGAVDLRTWSDSADTRSLLQFWRARGTEASPADTQVGDNIGKVAWHGREGGGDRGYGAINLWQAANYVSGSYVDSYVDIWLPSGGAYAQRFRFDQDGGVASGGTAVVNRTAGDARYGAIVFRTKATDTSRASNTTATADPDLQFAYTAGTWQVDIYVRVNAGSAGGLKVTAGGGLSVNAYGEHRILNRATSSIVAQGIPDDVIQATGWTSGSYRASVLFTATGSGTYSLNWAQSASDAANTTIIAGSSLVARKVN